MLHKKVFLLASTLLLAPMVLAPSAGANLQAAANGTLAAEAPGPSSDATADANANRALDALARALAAAVSNIEVRQILHTAVGKRFDGDENALWSSVAGGSTFNAKVAAAASRGQATKVTEEQIASTARAYPRLQVAVPAKFGAWNPTQYTPLVAFFPEGVDDTQLDTLTAYDADGNAVLLDAKTPPENPVIVVGMNERTDESGRLKNEESVDRSAESVETAAAEIPLEAYQVRMYLVDLKDDKEGWGAGDAEINMESKGDGCGFVYDDYNWENLNHDGDAWQGPRELGHTTCNVVFYWWEDDGGAWDYTLEWGGLNLGAHMDNDDDKIGGGRVLYADFRGSGVTADGPGDGWDKLEWTALYQYTD